MLSAMTKLDSHSMDSAVLHPVRWLGSHAPLERFAKFICERGTTEHGILDVSGTVIVLPGARAGRTCMRMLASAAEQAGISLRPPRVLTPGELEFHLRPPQGNPIASGIEWRLAVMRAIDESSVTDRARILPDGVSANESRGLAERIIAVQRELSVAGISWSHLANAAEERDGDPERYRVFERIIVRTQSILDGEGLQDPEHARENLDGGVDSNILEVILLGVVQLPQRLRQSLASVDVHPCICAEDSYRDGFDHWGTLKEAWWHAHSPEVPLERIRVEDKPIDQAESVVEHLSSRANGSPVQGRDIALVLADESMSDVLSRELVGAGGIVHRAQGQRVSATEPIRILADLAGLLESRTVDALRTLLAHPSFESAVRSRLPESEDTPECTHSAAMDRWLGDFHSTRLFSGWMGDCDDSEVHSSVRVTRRVLREVDVQVSLILNSLEGVDRYPGEWMPEIFAFLEFIFAAIPEDEQEIYAAPVGALRRMAIEFMDAPRALQSQMSAAEAVRVLMWSVGDDVIRESIDFSQGHPLEILGWLEAPFESVEHMVVVGMNDGSVPSTRGVDPMLPDNLRQSLGISSEYSRTARDAWVLSTILQRDAEFIFSRRDIRGEPRLPSRLLLTGSSDVLAQRVLSLTGEASSRSWGGAESGEFARPRPELSAGPLALKYSTISVTAFRRYLRCPYEFFLRHVLNLNVADRTGAELNARAFGIVLHEAVERYSKREDASLITDPERIESILHRYLHDEITTLVGSDSGVGVRIQTRILERRLTEVAAVQASENLAGWKIMMIEESFRESLEIPGQDPIDVRGKVDRVDYHEDLGWRILDFKSSDLGKTPDRAHWMPRSQKWIDLQLPLYQHLLQETLQAQHDAPVSTGYFLAPADVSKTGIVMSSEIRDHHDLAIAKAQEVVKNIRAGVFEPSSKTPVADDPLSLIYRVQSVGTGAEEEDDQ